MASRNQTPKWSGDGKYLAFVSDRSGRDEIWVSDPEGRAPKKITDLDNEKGALVWTPDSTALLYTAADRKLYSYHAADGKTSVVASSEVGRIGSVAVSPDSKWIAFSKQDRTLRSHVYIVPIAGGEERHVSDDSLLYSETNAVWTADGRYLVFTSSEGTTSGIASQGGLSATMELWALSLRDQDRDPTNRDIDNEAQGLAAEAAARQNTGRPSTGSGQTAPPEVRIDWNGLARRARQLSVPGTAIGGLTPAPEGHSVALTAGTPGAGGGRGGMPDANAGMYIINVESGQLTRVPAPPENAGAGAGRGGRGGAQGGPGGGASMAFARDGRTLYFRSGSGLFAAPINLTAAGAGAAAAGGGRAGGRGGRGGAPAITGTGRQCHGASGDLLGQHRSRSQGAARAGLQRRLADHEEPLLRSQDARRGLERHQGRLRAAPRLPRGRRRAEHRHDDDDWPAQRVAHGRQWRRSANDDRPALQTRHPGFDLAADPSGFYKVAHIYKDGPADRDYLKIKKGDFVVSVDDRDIKTSENYWQYFTLAAGSKFHFMVNDKPSKEGAWAVTISPIAGGAFGDLQYARWVADRKEMVTRLSNGDVGYLHIRAMDAPSLRQFQLDLAAQRTKKALVIDQRFNGGGGIDQELLAILAGRQYQYTIGRDAGMQLPRPQNFYGPMVVMQNERSASDAEMFPAGFKALGLGKVIGVPTMGAVIGTGSYTLLERRRDPHAGQRSVDRHRPEHGELRRAARRLRRQHAG